jgi:hypothetical protein
VKGHADHLNHDRGKCKHLNIIADEMCDIIRDEALGPMGAHAYNALYMPSLGYMCNNFDMVQVRRYPMPRCQCDFTKTWNQTEIIKKRHFWYGAVWRSGVGASSNFWLWENETCALFIRCIKIMSNAKERLTQQLLDGDPHKYIITKETWMDQLFDSINWVGYGTAFKRLPQSRQASMPKDCHNL